MIEEKYLQYLLLIVLPVVAFVVLRQRELPEEKGEIAPKSRWHRMRSIAGCGAPDGFYGPGTGTFLLPFSAIWQRWTCAPRAAM